VRGLAGAAPRRYRGGVGESPATHRLRLRHVLLLLPLVAILAWVADRARRERDDPAEVLRHLWAQQAPGLPDAAPAGAASRSPVEAYDRETLYEFIDGAAEAYIARGFERCAASTYVFDTADDSELEVAAEVYRFAAADGAAAQLAAERPLAGVAPPGLPGAVADGAVLVLAHGRDLLKLTSLGRGVDASGHLLAIARAWLAEQSR